MFTIIWTIFAIFLLVSLDDLTPLALSPVNIDLPDQSDLFCAGSLPRRPPPDEPCPKPWRCRGSTPANSKVKN